MESTNNNSLINFGDLSVPAKVLIEKVSEAVGGIFKPIQIKRVARAEAEASKIATLAQIEITELQIRALRRFVSEESIKQQNMENITAKALPLLEENSKPNEIEKDWLINYFDKARLISDEEIQTLWAKILAGESNSKGSYSKRTVNLLASFDKNDVLLFNKLTSFVLYRGNSPMLTIFNDKNTIYSAVGINFSTLKHLDSIGLISFEHLTGYSIRELSKRISLRYFDKIITVEFQNETTNSLDIGKALLTSSAVELVTMCTPLKNDEFLSLCKDTWEKGGNVVTTN